MDNKQATPPSRLFWPSRRQRKRKRTIPRTHRANRSNLSKSAVEITQPVLLYAMYVRTGIVPGRGPSFVPDLWVKIKDSIVSE